MFSNDASPPATPSVNTEKLLPTTVIKFEPKSNNTRSDLHLTLTALPTYSFKPYLRKGAHFAVNYTKESDRALIEIPGEIAKTARKINEDLPPIINFPLLFWFIELTFLGVGAFFAQSRPEKLTPLIAVLFTVVVLLVPILILRRFVSSLSREIKRLAHLHSATYYMQVYVQDFVWFWFEGGGLLTRSDAFMVGFGIGSRILLKSEVEYGPPNISDGKSKRELRKSGLFRVQKANKMEMMKEQMVTQNKKTMRGPAMGMGMGGGGAGGGMAKITPAAGGNCPPGGGKSASPKRARVTRRGSLQTPSS